MRYFPSKLNDYTCSRKTYYTLSFDCHFHIPGDTVHIAYAIPYTYSRLLEFLDDLQQGQKNILI